MLFQRFTLAESCRLSYILACGPDARRPAVDDELIRRGWLEYYDGDPAAVDATEGAAEAYYSCDGGIRLALIPQECYERRKRLAAFRLRDRRCWWKKQKWLTPGYWARLGHDEIPFHRVGGRAPLVITVGAPLGAEDRGALRHAC